MKKTFFFLVFFVLVIPIGRISYLWLHEHTFYVQKYKTLNEVYIEGSSAPRGRILDINGNVLVDNVGVPTIIYHKVSKITQEKEVEIARTLSSYLQTKEVSLLELKQYWIVTHPQESKNKITNVEYQALQERKLKEEDITKFMYERITLEDLNALSEEEKKAAKIYSLMQKGYTYEPKVLEKNVNQEIYAKILELGLSGIVGELTWERIYPYGDSLKGFFGTIGTIPEEEKETYLKKGYQLTDVVGLSYLEKQYEEYLKGEKGVYRVMENQVLEQIKAPKVGADVYLNIDIVMQQELEKITENFILEGKKSANTDLFTTGYVIVMDSKTGALKAVVGRRYVNAHQSYTFLDASLDTVLKSFTPGSIVKAASMSVGYLNGLITPGKQVKDACVKLYLNPEKCSYKSLGYVDDIRALKMSSNYYQFLLAIALTGNTYQYNMKLEAKEEDFEKYRSVFQSYGLGNTTGLDIPKEETGITGSKIAGDLLLNLAIGQYDTYTPMQLLQYINTVGQRGERIAPQFLKKIVKEETVLWENDKHVLNTIPLENIYYDRILEGLREVLDGGTGSGYVNTIFRPAGKTGTSESFLDTDNDAKIDASTISSSFVTFAPYDDTKYTIVVLSPHVVHKVKEDTPMVYINKKLSKAVTDYVFSNY